MIMIILKLKIRPVSVNKLSPVTTIMSEKLQWLKREYPEEDQEKIKQLVEWVETIYDKTDDKSPIKSISTKEVPVYLDNEDKQKLSSSSVEIKREVIESYVRELQNEIDRLKNEIEQEQNQELGIRIDALETRKNKLEESLGQNPKSDTISIKKEYSRLGYYTRNDHNPEIVLLMGAIGNNKQLLVSTYIHEMFHAYFDLCWIEDKKNPKYEKQVDSYIEEPLTEYAMLKFLDKFVQTNSVPEYANLLENAARNVMKKQFSPGTCHYGFGYYLWKWEKDNPNKPFDWIECYKKAKFKIRNSKDKHDFESPFAKGLYPFGKEKKHMELLRKILTPKCKQQGNSIVSTGGGVKNKRKKDRLFGQYL